MCYMTGVILASLVLGFLVYIFALNLISMLVAGYMLVQKCSNIYKYN